MGPDLIIDETIHAQQQCYMVDFGTGVVDWTAWAAAMAATPGHETVLLELDVAPDPIAALKAGKAVVERVAA